ncbi:unnamed protein product, partial [Effrenium voratum]
MACKGDKFAAFYSELAATPENCKDAPYRVGVGLSRLAEVLLNSIEEFQSRDFLRKLLKDSVVKKVDEEAGDLLPHLKAKGPQAPEAPGAAAVAPTADELAASAKKLYEFLSSGTNSNLRALVATLSAGGVLYAAHCADSLARRDGERHHPAPGKKETLKSTLLE